MSTNDARATGSALSSDVSDRVAARIAGRNDPLPDGDRPRPPVIGPEAVRLLATAADDVLRPEGVGAAAAGLHRLAADLPDALPWFVRGALQLGGAVAPVLPTPAVPVARRAVRDLVARLVLDARSERLGADIAAVRADSGLDVRLAGPAVLGDAAARRRVDGIRALLSHDDVDRISFTLRDVLAGLGVWGFDAHVERAAERILPIVLDAAGADVRPTLVVEGRDDLDLGVAVLTRVLEEPRLQGFAAGIALPVAVPDAADALRELAAWARVRVADGGAPLHVRLVDGVPTTDELVDAARSGWSAPFAIDRDDLDALVVAAVRTVLDERVASGLRVQVQTADGVVAELARALADDAGTAVEIVAPRSFVPAAGADVVLAPVVHPDDLDVVAADIARAAAEAAAAAATSGPGSAEPAPSTDGTAGDDAPASDAAASGSPDDDGPASPVAERVDRALRRAGTTVLPPRFSRRGRAGAPSILRDRADDEAVDGGLTQAVLGIARDAAAEDTSALGPDVQQMLFGGQAFVDTAVFSLRETADAAEGAVGFRNAARTDPTIPADRAWARDVLARSEESTAGDATAAAGRVDDAEGLDAVIDRVRTGAEPWSALGAADRAVVLQAAARSLEERRGELLEVLASEAGVLVAEGDAEVNAAVDAAAYYAVTAKELDRVPGAVFVPDRVTVVAPRWNSAVGLCAAETLAALATGSGVVLTPSPRARRAGAVVAEALWAAGVPRDVLAYVDLNEEASGRSLLVHPGVDRVLLAGARATAERFVAWRPELPLQAVTAGRNVVVVAPSADVDDAVAALVEGAFARAGQAPGAASLAILVGSAARSSRIAAQLADAVSSLRVGPASDPRSDIGPLVEEPTGEVRRALTVLETGERWLVQPRELDLGPDTAGRFWTPGVRIGVHAGSHLTRTAVAAPVLGVLHAPSMTRAIELQNLLGSGLVAGLHTRDAADLDLWLDGVEAATLRVNRSTVGFAAQREPLGGWGEANVGTGTMAGGPNRLVALGSWRPSSGGPASSTLHLRGLDSRIAALIEAAQPTLGYEAFEWLRRGALSDAVAWDREFGRVKDVSRLGVERNLWRYRPVDVAVRATGDASWQAVLRVLVAAVRSASTFTLSTPVGLPAEVRHLLGDGGVAVSVESDAQWLQRMAGGVPDAAGDTAADPPAAPAVRPSRVRLVGPAESVRALRAALVGTIAGDPAVTVYADEVTTAGRIELLPFLREQAISIAAFRHGRPDPWSTAVI
ncbi:proline dehydrogenase family protein [Microbacterium sp. LMI1-1-1.1]|uniref:proline dehydrogenase family protein n=1 Tax=Microbacterium sp. LMI1-1-1.1 TaxID=3135223 RepID=UPI003466F570